MAAPDDRDLHIRMRALEAELRAHGRICSLGIPDEEGAQLAAHAPAGHERGDMAEAPTESGQVSSRDIETLHETLHLACYDILYELQMFPGSYTTELRADMHALIVAMEQLQEKLRSFQR
jgi:hypothetical protein